MIFEDASAGLRNTWTIDDMWAIGPGAYGEAEDIDQAHGSSVSVWTERSPAGRTFTPGSSTPPILEITNGVKEVVFNGSNHRLATPTWGWYSAGAGFAAAVVTAPPSGGKILFGSNSGSLNDPGYSLLRSLGSTTGRLSARIEANDASVLVSCNNQVAAFDNTLKLVSTRDNGSNIELYINAVKVWEEPYSRAGKTLTLTEVSLGAKRHAVNNWPGRVRAFFGVAGWVDDDNLANFHAYMMAKHGV